MQELFAFERQGINEDGGVLGRFKPSGIRPKFADTLKSRGIELAGSLFLDRPVEDHGSPSMASSERGRW
jgi:hypothetical protein